MLKKVLLGFLCLGVVLVSFSSITSDPSYQQCRTHPLALQVLGSGGPIADDARASSGYLLWVDGQARLLIDSGSGTFLAIPKVGADLESLDLLALTHFHVDHVGDFPALMKSAFFGRRRRVLPVSGPAGNKHFPNTKEYLRGLFDPNNGVYRYLSGYLKGDSRHFKLDPIIIKGAKDAIVRTKAFSIDATPVPHGPVPSLAYRVTTKTGKIIVVSGDQNGSDKSFIKFAKGADLLVMPMAISQGSDKVAKFLHATPAKIGEIAQLVNPKVLVLSHLMRRSIASMDENLAIIKRAYKGKVIVADDLNCLEL